MKEVSEIRVENGKLVFGNESCTCMDGKLFAHKVCPDCKGTRRGKRGGHNGCKTCYMGTVVDYANKVTCTRCDGTALVPANRYSHIDANIIRSLPWRVERGNKPQTFAQAYFGLGSIVSVTDYGRYKNLNDEELIETAKQSINFPQALSICDKDNNVCKSIVVVTNNQGYEVKAEF